MKPTAGVVSTPASNKRPPATPSSSGQKKRPYRRTKRPKNYCDKSTVTTINSALNAPVNVYDAVLGECEDLLTASLEAQRLGRLKMASAYQLLLHTRLVGLGKRFDRTTVAPPVRRRNDDDSEPEEEEEEVEEESNHQGDTPVTAKNHLIVDQNNAPESAINVAPQPAVPAPASASPAVAAAGAEKEEIDPDGLPPDGLPPALQQLTSILPSNLEMDGDMMEHLARAAVELHHQRTGRKKSADGLLASPMTGLIGSPPTNSNMSNKDNKKGAASNNSDKSKIAWTPQEQAILVKAQKEKKTPEAIAALLASKTEVQVKAFVKNQQKTAQTSSQIADEMASPNSKKRGGRGRKPPTTAMNTVPNANLDAKSLLKGLLQK